MKLYDASQSDSIRAAAETLKRGGLVAFPTETVYGLGADFSNDKAVCRIFEVKKRPSFDPLIVHVSSPEQAMTLCRDFPRVAKALVEVFWPGPLTLVLPKSEKVSDLVTSGLATVAVRMPNHEAALALIREFGKPVAAPSANLFGYTSPTSAVHVRDDMGEAVDMILDGGPCRVGLESTVLKIDRGKGVILRPGGISAEQLSKYLPVSAVIGSATAIPESPGQMGSHYSPWTRMLLMPTVFADFKYGLPEGAHPRMGLLAFKTAPAAEGLESVQVLSASGDLVEAAANLFQAIRKLDKMNLDLILAEPVPEQGIGRAIMDRLRKASAGKMATEDLLNS